MRPRLSSHHAHETLPPAAAICLAVLIAPVVRAETPPAPAPAPPSPAASVETRPSMLHLGATDFVRVTPDTLVADLVAVAVSTSPVTAQRHVNTMMAAAAKLATGVAGITTSLLDYSVSFTDERPPRWTAQQTLEVKGADSERLLDLVAQLQAAGLVAGNLAWQVSDERHNQAYDEALGLALKKLRARASLAAQAVGMQVDRLQDLRLENDVRPLPTFNRAMVPASAMVAGMPPPNVTATPRDVSASVSADVILKAGQ
jgi:uncharacterized protein YggE